MIAKLLAGFLGGLFLITELKVSTHTKNIAI